jgi:hypothetical protein
MMDGRPTVILIQRIDPNPVWIGPNTEQLTQPEEREREREPSSTI